MLPTTIKTYCGFPGDLNYMIEPFRICSTIANTTESCSSKSVLETVGCFWQAGSCVPTKVGFEGYCSSKLTSSTCYSTPVQYYTDSCVLYHVEVTLKAFCGFPYDANPWIYPPTLCSITAKNATACESSGFLSSTFCAWNRTVCSSAPGNTQFAAECSSFKNASNCYAFRGGFGYGSCTWFASTVPPTATPSTMKPSLSTDPSALPSHVPTISLSPTLSSVPSMNPSGSPSTSSVPSSVPSAIRTRKPTRRPTPPPTAIRPISINLPAPPPATNPTKYPSPYPTRIPTAIPTPVPTNRPTLNPTPGPTIRPTRRPNRQPIISTSPPSLASWSPTYIPSRSPTSAPSTSPSTTPSELPSTLPSLLPSKSPSTAPSGFPSARPSQPPSMPPTSPPSFQPYEPEAVEGESTRSTTWIAGFGVAGAAVGGAACCGACFWLSKKKTETADGHDTGDGAPSTFGTGESTFGTDLDKRSAATGVIPTGGERIALEGDETLSADDVQIRPLVSTGKMRKGGVILETQYPPGWVGESLLRSLNLKDNPTPPTCIETGDTVKPVIIVGSPPGWMWARLIRIVRGSLGSSSK